MDYGEILSSTWKTIWKHKAIFGFGLLGMAVPALMVFLMGGYFAFSTPQGLENIFDFFYRSNFFTVIFIGIILLLNLVSLVFTALSHAGVFKGMLQAESGADRLSFNDLWEASWPFVARIIGLFLLVGLGSFIAFFIPALLGIVSAGVFFLCLLPLFIILTPLSILLYFFVPMSMAAIVGDNLGLFAAFSRVWGLLKGKFWPLVVMNLILYLVQMLASMIMVLPMFFIQALMVIPLASGNVDETLIFRGFGILMAVFLPFAFLVQGLSLAFINSAWMVTYLRLTRGPAGAVVEPPTQPETV